MNMLFQDETEEKVEVSSSSDKLKKNKSLDIFSSLIQSLYLKGYLT